MKIAGYSTALFASWFYLEEYGLLFDCGDGVSAQLMLKGGGVRHIFLTHADRDHLGGLFQFLQLNARAGLPKVYFPADCGSFPAMEAFLERFDPHVSGAEWIPIRAGEEIEVKRDIFVQALRNEHVKAEESQHKSFSYRLVRRKRKLKREYLELSGVEIGTLRKEHGEAYISDLLEEALLGYSGDTPVGDASYWQDVSYLIHEATFLSRDDVAASGNAHSTLVEVLEMVQGLKLKALLLTHFSARYSKEQIATAIGQEKARLSLSFPIIPLYPGEFHKDLLALPAN